jgi:predicted alpha/beta-fold hydrolase
MRYRAPVWLPGGHAQTIYPTFLRRPIVAYRREVVETPDGDFWDFDWLVNPAPVAGDAPVVALFHGLESGSSAHYAIQLMRRLATLGWRGVVPHFRGCGGTPNWQPRAYHSGDHEEIAAMLAAVRARIGGDVPLFAVGVSLGASALLNWLGRAGSDGARIVTAAAGISAPLDLMASGRSIDTGVNRIYALNFLHTLVPKALAMDRRFPGFLDARRVARARTMWTFDDAVTAPLHGFAGADDYWTRASSKPWLRGIGLPTLVLNARNDPFIPGTSLPGHEDVSTAVTLEQPDHGGHVGFLTPPMPGRLSWLAQRVTEYLTSASPMPIASGMRTAS